ncbi:MAG TPA: dipeptide ABC transporter ATP-binding protein [Geminicoccus sp.]|uniref:dipeptide ABC transporter ATP-binding protein n=1 Tax=Geminicoccus sp. TaxID=2024832 RepID=UPI002C76E3F6|nr:dipeptide ABC transporter ATP-binding protein [Geminicoccus sp.]HWL68130.1 dipeptide ABC transporter ATP-binding protein [Geminicoccus sp.]
MSPPVNPPANQIVEADNLSRHYTVRRGLFAKPATVRALDGVSFTLDAGKTLAVVGESGCGKSTLGRIVTLIEPPSGGRLLLDGQPTDEVTPELRRKVQLVFQNPYGSLNPRRKIADALAEPLEILGGTSAAERRDRVLTMLEKVGLRREQAERYPHMFSGGQRQRIAVARALMPNPEVLVLDEPVSALDLSIQAQVLNLLMDLQDEFRLAYLFISHDLSVVRHIAQDVMVMYLGKAVEKGPKAAIFATPRHPYTRVLLAATPIADPRRRRDRIKAKGELPSPLAPPPGCPFHPRCPLANERCRVEVPGLTRAGEQLVACHAVEEGRD